MVDRVIVGFHGKAFAGKSTAARHLVEHWGFHLEKMAGPLKDICRSFGLTDEHLEGSLKESPCDLFTMARFDDLISCVRSALSSLRVAISEPIPALDNLPKRYVEASLAGVLAEIARRGDKDGGASPRLVMQMIGTEWGRDLIHPDLWTDLWLRRVAAQGGRNVVCDDVRFPNEVNVIRSLGGKVVVLTRREQCLWSEHESERHVIAGDFDIVNTGKLREFHESLDRVIRPLVTAPDEEAEALVEACASMET